MKKTMILTAAILLSLCANPAWAKEPKQFVADFINDVNAGKISQAYDGLLQGSGIAQAKPQDLEVLKSQTSNLLSFYGSVLDSEIVREEKIGNSIVRLVYILKHEKTPVIWQFYFYRPHGKWFLGKIDFNDQFQNLEKTQ